MRKTHTDTIVSLIEKVGELECRLMWAESRIRQLVDAFPGENITSNETVDRFLDRLIRTP